MNNTEMLEVTYWPVDRPLPYPRNPRKISQSAVSKVAGSIKEFGWRQPIVVDEEGVIIVGHTRLQAAQMLGLEKVPVHVVSSWSEQKKRAYRLADNRVGEESSWDEDLLSIELSDLAPADQLLTGFSRDELDRFAYRESVGITDPDDVPDLPTEPVSRPGDLWLLGSHRVLCGDATKADDVERLQGSVRAHLMVTDPPYGVDYDPTWREGAGLGHTDRTGEVLNDDRADWSAAWAHFPGDVAYVWHGALHATTVAESLIRSGFSIRAQIIWGKERHVIGRGHYHWQHEPCWYAVRNKGHWTGGRKQSTLWHIPSREEDCRTVHSTQKPAESMRRPIVNNSNPGQAVYDPFLGSGTTLIAAEMEGRSCLGMELNPAYVDLALMRWMAFTGGDATLDDGRTDFDAVADLRRND